MNRQPSAIIVSTPFQLMSAFSIVENNRDREFDLYIIGNFKNYLAIANRIEKLAIFSNVAAYNLNDIRVGHKRRPLLRTLLRQVSYLRFIAIGKKVSIPGREYEEVYYAAAVSAAELLMYFQWMYKPKFILFDDGIMTYRNVNRVLGTEEKVQFVKKIIFKRIGDIHPEIMVYLPRLFEEMNPKAKKPISLVPISDKTKRQLCSVFEIGNDSLLNSECLIIECNVKDYLSNKSINYLEGIYSLIEEKIGSNNVAYKRHPRDERDHNLGRRYLSGGIPFELFGCVEDLSNKLLIAWDSTATLTPKMFYDQEPRVVLLYRLVEGIIDNYQETDRLYTLFSNLYNDGSKFLIPNSKEELKVIIESLPKKV